jgi:plastocyanin
MIPLHPSRPWRRCARAVSRAACALLLVVAVAPALAPAPSDALDGTIELVEKGETVPGGGGAVVWYEPEGGAPRAAPRAAQIGTREKRFLPRVTVVPPRSTVAFPNHDPIFHNVFSVSAGNRFDLGRYREGETRSTRLDKPGLVRVYCNVHEQMVAYVMVVESAFHAVADEAGRFRLDGLPPGRGTLVVWHERAGTRRIPITIPSAESPRVRLDATAAGGEPHLNKFGRPYGAEPQDDSYC